MKYVIVWSEGKHHYTHTDEEGNPVSFSLEELTRDQVPIWDGKTDGWPPEIAGRTAILLNDLYTLLGVEYRDENS